MVSAAGAILLGQGGALATANLGWQAKAWRYYGAPDETNSSDLRANQGAIGEVRSVMGWIAEQIGRIHWDVAIDGKTLEQVESDELMLKVANNESTINITTNLIVAGELNYVAMTEAALEILSGKPGFEALAGPVFAGDPEALWIPVSVVDNHRKELLEGADLNLRAIWPHPGKPTVADPPLRGVIDVLEEIEQVQDLAYSQNRSRIAQMGILTVASEFDLGVPGGDFKVSLEEAINAQIHDPRRASAAPILLRGPFEMMTGALSNGARAVQWTRPPADGFDERLDDKMRFLIQRLAWGFPIAPEILLGMTATNRAVAFQVEESTYRSHLEPIAKLVGRIYARALKMILSEEFDGQRVNVNPDATELLARRHSVADAKDLYDRGLVNAEFVRRVAGIQEEDAATQEDLDRIVLLRKGSNAGAARELDPSEVAGNEPVRASAAFAHDGATEALRAAVSMAARSAVSRVGAAARTRLGRLNGIGVEPPLEVDPDSVSNGRLPSILGVDRLASLGIDFQAAIHPAADQLADWWDTYAVSPTSRHLLVQQFTDWCAATCCSWPSPPVPDEMVDPVVAAVLVSPVELGEV
jgi:hypothetical protein